jgi:hypothetical protein
MGIQVGPQTCGHLSTDPLINIYLFANASRPHNVLVQHRYTLPNTPEISDIREHRARLKAKSQERRERCIHPSIIKKPRSTPLSTTSTSWLNSGPLSRLMSSLPRGATSQHTHPSVPLNPIMADESEETQHILPKAIQAKKPKSALPLQTTPVKPIFSKNKIYEKTIKEFTEV